MKNIANPIWDTGCVVCLYILIIVCMIWWGSELLSKADHRAAVVRAEYSEVGR